jgi:Uma2 family endonuclease
MATPEVRQRGRLTKHDYYDLPELGPRYQLIEGRMFMAPAPDRSHQHFSGNLEYQLRRYLEEHPIGLLYDAPFDVELNDVNVYQPDIVFVSHARSSIFTEHGAAGAPNLVIEILSPKTARFDLGLKREVYFESGVEELWIVDPKKRELAIYLQGISTEAPAATLRSGDTLTTRVLPGFVLPVDAIFAGL